MVFNVVTKYQHCKMPFSNKDKPVIKNLYQFKEYGQQVKFLKTNCRGEDWAYY